MLLKITGLGQGSAPVQVELALSSAGTAHACRGVLSPGAAGAVPQLQVQPQDPAWAAMAEAIGRHGVSRLQVRVASPDAGFHSLCWEQWTLPGQTEPLASQVASFTRVLPDCASDAERELGLSASDPLRLLHLASRPELRWPCERETDSFRLIEDLQDWGAALQVQWTPGQGWDALRKQGAATGGAHVVHYDGPIRLDGDQVLLFADGPGAAEQLDAVRFAALAKAAGVACVLLSTPLCFDASGPVNASMGIARLASALLRAGLPAVVGVPQPVPSWRGREVLLAVIEPLLQGQALAQAVAIARRAPPAPDASTGRPVVLFANQTLQLFDKAVPRDPAATQQRHAGVRQRLHGFQAGLLPPELPPGTDAAFADALRQLAPTHRVRLLGDEGQGKTRAAHLLAWHLCAQGADRAFYFEFASGFYGADDVLRMIAEVLHLPADQVPQALSASRNVFVLDDYLAAGDDTGQRPHDEAIGRLERLLDGLGAQNVLVFTGASAAPRVGLGGVVDVPLPALSAAALLHAFEAPAEAMHAAAGNPWLAQRLAALGEQAPRERLLADAQHALHRAAEVGLAQAFHERQWAALPPTWQAWMLAFMEHPGLFLEVFGAADPAQDTAAMQAWRRLHGAGPEALSDGLPLLARHGFVARRPYGHVVERKSLRFLGTVARARDAERELATSEMACECFARVMGLLQRQDNPVVAANLLGNRHHLARHMARLWAAGRVTVLHDTLRQAEGFLTGRGLGPELAQWARQLLSSPAAGLPAEGAEFDDDTAACWLRLSLLTTRSTAPEESLHALATARQAFGRWLDAQTVDSAALHPALFSGCVDFLQRCCLLEQQPAGAVRVGKQALPVYRSHQAWPQLARQLLLLGASLLADDAGGQRAVALAHHDELMRLLRQPDALQAGERVQARLQLLAQRLRHGVHEAGQALLDECRRDLSAANQPVPPLLELLQAEWLRAAGEHTQALAAYRALAGRMPSPELNRQVQARLDALGAHA